jgi:hypothetical protein
MAEVKFYSGGKPSNNTTDAVVGGQHQHVHHSAPHVNHKKRTPDQPVQIVSVMTDDDILTNAQSEVALQIEQEAESVASEIEGSPVNVIEDESSSPIEDPSEDAAPTPVDDTPSSAVTAGSKGTRTRKPKSASKKSR